MNSLSIRGKLMILCSSLMIISAIIGGFGYYSSQKTQIIYKEITDSIFPGIQAMDQLVLILRRGRLDLLQLIIGGSAQKKLDEKLLSNIEAMAKDYVNAEKGYLAQNLSTEESTLYREIKIAGDLLQEDIRKSVELFKKNMDPRSAEYQQVLKIILVDSPAHAQIFRDGSKKLTDYQSQHIAAATQSAVNASKSNNFYSLLLIILGIAGGGLFAIYVATELNRQLSRISESLATGSSEVSSALVNLTTASQALSSAATEQAAALQETVASVEEISAMANKSADSAKESGVASAQSKTQAERGKVVVNQMIQSMSDIDHSNQTVLQEITTNNNKITEIIKLIEEIGTKTKVINDIVFQTKLLSFNASVEAARAGEHGKGFAVVAEEVGNLAQMSGNSAKEISTLLESSIQQADHIIQETKQKVEVITAELKKSVERGGSVARECGEVLDHIVSHATTVSEMVQSIAESGREQSRGITEVSKAMQQLDLVTQNNNSAANQTASATSELSTQAQTLMDSSMQLKHIIEGVKA